MSFNQTHTQHVIDALTRGKRSLVDFYREFCFDEPEDYLPPADFHYKISDILLHGGSSMAIEAFRESGKTEIAIRAYFLYELTFHSKHRRFFMLLLKNSSKESAKYIRQIATEFKMHPILSGRIVEIITDTTDGGGTFEVVLKAGKKMDEHMVLRIEGAGKGSSVRGASWYGQRPHVVVGDDLQDKEDAWSDTTLDKDWEWFMSDVKFLSKHGKVILIGNNLGAKCLIERVIEHKDELGFEVLRIPVADNTMGENPAWTAKYTTEEIVSEVESARKMGTLELLMQELFCQALSEENRKFKKEYFRYYKSEDKPKLVKSCNIYIVTDMAISQKKSADFSVIAVMGVNSKNFWFVFELEYGRWNEDEFIDRVFKLVGKYPQVRKVGIEMVAFQAVMKSLLEKEMSTRNRFFDIVEEKADKQKEIRVSMVSPRFAQGHVLFEEDAPYLPEAESQFLMFPKAKHDDIPDTIGHFENIAEIPPDESIFGDFSQVPEFTGSY